MRNLFAHVTVYGLIVVVGGAFGCSSTRPELNVRAAVTSDPAVAQILAVSCTECHSNEGAGLWYARLQPSRWFGDRGLQALNFSDWGSYDDQRRTDAIRQIAAVIDSGAMPPASYLLFHPGARLSPGQKRTIDRWAAAQGAVAAH
jgi:hypothetical protein